MEFAVKRFARRILLLHLLLLVGVFGMVLLASRAIRAGAREQAIKQAERRQRVLANQTARGIESFYHSILSDMDLVPRDGDAVADRANAAFSPRELWREFQFPMLGGPATQPTDPPGAADRKRGFGPGLFGGGGGGGGGGGSPPGGGRPGNDPAGGLAGTGATRPGSPAGRPPAGPQNGPKGRGRGVFVGQILGRQLEERVTHLFFVTRQPEPPVPTKAAAAKAAASPSKKLPPDLLLGDVIVKPKEGEGLKVEALVERYHGWLAKVRDQAISPFELFSVPVRQEDGSVREETGGFNLVAIPAGGGGGGGRNALLVAAVPVSKITETFLSALNEDADTGVALVNDSLTIMAASRAAVVGANVEAAGDPDLRAAFEAFKSPTSPGTDQIEHRFAVGQEWFEPALLTAEPIKLDKSTDKTSGKRNWFVVVSSPLSDVDANVAQLFGTIVGWAVVVVVLMTGILVSTAATMIRSRVRLERVRHEVIRKELDRARQIQQAWLPEVAPNCRTVDLAAVNFPANHISGDFYNWFELAGGRIAVVIGDVTGHGMSAAFLMATTQLLVRTTMQRMTDPAACLEEVNRQLCTLVFNEQFVTIQILVLDPDGGPVKIASAGHPAPLLADHGVFNPLDAESGLVLGVDPETTYETHTIDLPAGASLLLYTDGAPDVIAPNGSRLGTDGLRATCPLPAAAAAAKPKAGRRLGFGHAVASRTATPRTDRPQTVMPGVHGGDPAAEADGEAMPNAKAMLDAVVSSINHFRGSRELADDLTFVAVRLTRCAPAPEPEMAGMA
jgi:hypothetical protein